MVCEFQSSPVTCPIKICPDDCPGCCPGSHVIKGHVLLTMWLALVPVKHWRDRRNAKIGTTNAVFQVGHW